MACLIWRVVNLCHFEELCYLERSKEVKGSPLTCLGGKDRRSRIDAITDTDCEGVVVRKSTRVSRSFEWCLLLKIDTTPASKNRPYPVFYVDFPFTLPLSR
ncbi:hypothetical protein PoB_004078200 [Plakobranchus ocellatus]|uniref:Uncharacterized protein n=1 Tax=Plakobranchus ocellatus TaxID=259542 RepID=A0AAV4B508_9GAST|nr:hypothetical protein PoB_004078200 [Plakobranchus ocellatus]